VGELDCAGRMASSEFSLYFIVARRTEFLSTVLLVSCLILWQTLKWWQQVQSKRNIPKTVTGWQRPQLYQQQVCHPDASFLSQELGLCS